MSRLAELWGIDVSDQSQRISRDSAIDINPAPEVVIISRRMTSNGFADNMFYTGRREYGVPLFDHDGGNAMRFTESEAQQVIGEGVWPYEVRTIPVMGN